MPLEPTIVGWSGEVGWTRDNSVAFIWTANDGMQRLDVVLTALGVDLTGWTPRAVTGVSDDGNVIIGVGMNPSGFGEAWLATIPEPTMGLLVMTELLGLAGWRRRRV